MSELRVTVHHLKALQVEARARTHSIVVDRPADLGGEDLGMTIGEVFLSSLGACTLLTVLSFCKNNGVPIEGGEVHLSADLAEHPKRIGAIRQQLSSTERSTLPWRSGLRGWPRDAPSTTPSSTAPRFT